MPVFYCEKIEVVRDQKTKLPVSFSWNGKEYKIVEVIATWPDWGFSAGSPKRKNWRLRRHRNFFRILTQDNQAFEIYHDRKTKLDEGEWILYTKIN